MQRQITYQAWIRGAKGKITLPNVQTSYCTNPCFPQLLYQECSQSEQGNLTSRLSAGDGHVRPCNERGSSTSNETQVRYSVACRSSDRRELDSRTPQLFIPF